MDDHGNNSYNSFTSDGMSLIEKFVLTDSWSRSELHRIYFGFC
jgi:hypothetical protein